jgi:5-methylcytosine-specific restriction protein A
MTKRTASLSRIERKHLLAAIKDFDRIGREAFLAKFKCRASKGYMLAHGGQLYDSKAIICCAYGKISGEAALSSKDFSGGPARLQSVFTRNGFELAEIEVC